MVDRGGLNYPIRVPDGFSRPLAQFRAELEASKKSVRSFRAELARQRRAASGLRQAAKASRELAQSQADLAKASRSTRKPLSDEERALRRLEQAAKRQAAREREAAQIRARQNADRRRRVAEIERAARAEERAARSAEAARRRQAATDPRLTAEKRVNNELFKQKVLVQEIALLRNAAASQRASGDLIGGDATLRRAKQLEKSLGGSARSAGQIFFTFRRLVGTLAIFTLAREGVQTFNQLVAAGVKFNDTIESSRLGVAGLIATLTDVRTPFGGIVDQADQLELALGVSRKQVEALRQDSLKTVATFTQLLDTFQVAVGPGLAAGLNLDEIRTLTVRISQAAAALSVPQNQLAEEIRSLLSGTIQARTTRIATALGITNEDIRRLKETGELFDELDRRLAGFDDSARRAARETLGGVGAVLKGAFESLVGAASQDLFNELIDLGNDLIDNVLTVRDAVGNLQPNPQVVEAFRAIFNAIRDILRAVASAGEALGFQGLQATLEAIGFVMQALVGSIGVVLRLFAELAAIIGFVREQIGLSSEETGTAAQRMGEWATRIGIALILVKKLNVELLKSARGPLLLVGAFTAIAKAVEFIVEKIFDVNVNLRETVELITLGLFGAFIKVVEVVQTLGTKIVSSIRNGLTIAITAAKDQALAARSFIASLFGDDAEAQRLEEERFRIAREANKELSDQRKKDELEIAAIRDEALAKQKAVEEEIAAIIGDAAKRNAQGEGFDPNFQIPEPGEGGGDPRLVVEKNLTEETRKRLEALGLENQLLRAQASAQEALTAATVARGGQNQIALIQAENALAVAREELIVAIQKADAEILAAQAAALAVPAGSEEREALVAVVEQLRQRKDFESRILADRIEQLKLAKEEAELVANGSLTEGLKEGFRQFAEEFSSTFNAAITIAKQSTQALAAFVSQSIIDAFDPNKDGTIEESFGRFLQQIARIVLNTLIQNAIAEGLQRAFGKQVEASIEVAAATEAGAIRTTAAQTAAGIEIAAAETAAAIRAASSVAGNTGGLVIGGRSPKISPHARGYNRGGRVQPPPGIHPLDTVPAWLTPGEFVLRKSAVDAIGLPTLQAMNGGNMSVVGAASAETAGPATGMQSGGVVRDQVTEDRQGGGEDRELVVLPAVPANDRTMDTITSGGRNALLAFMRENAGSINTLLDRGAGR